MAMNQHQKQYCMSRVKEILNHKLEVLKRACTKLRPASELPDSKKLSLIRGALEWGDDTVKLRKGRSIRMSCSLAEAFIFEGDCDQEEFDGDRFFKEEAKLRKEAGKVTDEIMLGDEKKAKTLLEKYAK